MSDSVRFEFSCAMVATATSAGADRKLPGNRTLSPFTRPLNCPPSSVSHPEIIKCINGGNECDLSHSLTALITDHYVDLMHIVTHRLTSIATFVFRQRITDRHKKISWKCYPREMRPSSRDTGRIYNQTIFNHLEYTLSSVNCICS
jgi:hypothetical protein